MEDRRLARKLARVVAAGAVEPQLREAPDGAGAYVGGPGCACPLGGGRGAGCGHGGLWSRRLPAATEAVVAWTVSLPGPVAVAYEAGPTGFGLARALAAVGVRCVVVAPSKLERPAGDRVKTDRRDAERLARLLHLGELPAVWVPASSRRRRGIWSGPGRTPALT